MNDIDKARLIAAACEVRSRAYAPFSNFFVGAALLTAQDEVIVGCNVENVSYGLTICAERVAIGAAVASGIREFLAIAIASSNGCAPCGACRQALAEFCQDIPVYLVNVEGGATVTETSLARLFPGRFDLHSEFVEGGP